MACVICRLPPDTDGYVNDRVRWRTHDRSPAGGAGPDAMARSLHTTQKERRGFQPNEYKRFSALLIFEYARREIEELVADKEMRATPATLQILDEYFLSFYFIFPKKKNTRKARKATAENRTTRKMSTALQAKGN